MSSNRPTRTEQRAASEASILDVAVELYAQFGPDGVSLREVATSAGLTHALVARYFGSKEGLVTAVEDRLETDLQAVWADGPTSAEVLVGLLAAVRARPTLARLLVRSGLGDLDGTAVPAVIGARCPGAVGGDHRRRLCGYGAASLVLGWVAWHGFLVTGLRLGRTSARSRDAAIAGAAASVLQLADRTVPDLAPRRLTSTDVPTVAPHTSARDALLSSAVHLFAEHGPASVSVRDIARHAGMSHALVHRHFGSKDELLTEAIEVGSATLQPGAFSPEGFSIDQVVHAMHGSPSPKTIARVLLDDVPVGTVRPRQPVLGALLVLVEQRAAASRPPAVGDPRLAAAAAAALVVGSAIWGPALREVFGLADDVGVESGVADLGQWLIGAPAR